MYFTSGIQAIHISTVKHKMELISLIRHTENSQAL